MANVPWRDAAAKADNVRRIGRLFSLPLALIPREVVARPTTLPLNLAVIEVDVTEYPLRLGKEQQRKWLSRISPATRRRLTRGQVDRWLNISRPRPLFLSLFFSLTYDYVRTSLLRRGRCQLRRTMKQTRPLRWRDRPNILRISTRPNWLIVGTIWKVSRLLSREMGEAVSLSKVKIVSREEFFLEYTSAWLEDPASDSSFGVTKLDEGWRTKVLGCSTSNRIFGINELFWFNLVTMSDEKMYFSSNHAVLFRKWKKGQNVKQRKRLEQRNYQKLIRD